MVTEGKQCSERVSHDDWGHTHQCPRGAKVIRNGKLYCKIHDPEYIAGKEAERTAKFDAEWAAKKATWELQNTAIRACKKINPENPQAVAESIEGLVEAVEAYEDTLNLLIFQHPDDKILATQMYQVIKVLAKVREVK